MNVASKEVWRRPAGLNLLQTVTEPQSQASGHIYRMSDERNYRHCFLGGLDWIE